MGEGMGEGMGDGLSLSNPFFLSGKPYTVDHGTSSPPLANDNRFSPISGIVLPVFHYSIIRK
jgi:hypothetical protein